MPAKRSCSLKNVRRNYTYTPEEIAGLFNVAPSTVFRWIRQEGLDRIEAGKKYHVHSSALIAFINEQNKKRKVKCKADQIYCFKCRAASHVRENSLKIVVLPNGTVRISAQCMVCGCKMNKAISSQNYNENHPLFLSSHEVNKTLNAESEPPLECNSLGDVKND